MIFQISGAASLPETSAGCEWFVAASDWCVSWSGKERYWLWHRPVAQTSPCLHSSIQQYILNIHRDRN